MENTKKIAGTTYSLMIDEDIQSYKIGWQRGDRWSYADYPTAYHAQAAWMRLT